MSKKYDIVLSSKELKRAVIDRINNNQVNTFKLCERAGISYKRFQSWTNDTDPRHKGSSIINHEDLLAICGLIGIEPRLMVVLKKEYVIEKRIKTQ